MKTIGAFTIARPEIKRSNDPLRAAILYAERFGAPQPYGSKVADAIRAGMLPVDTMPYVIAHLCAQLDAK